MFSGFNFPLNQSKERKIMFFFLLLATVRLQRKTSVTNRAFYGPGCGEFDSGRGVVAHVLRALGAMAAMTRAARDGEGHDGCPRSPHCPKSRLRNEWGKA